MRDSSFVPLLYIGMRETRRSTLTIQYVSFARKEKCWRVNMDSGAIK